MLYVTFTVLLSFVIIFYTHTLSLAPRLSSLLPSLLSLALSHPHALSLSLILLYVINDTYNISTPLGFFLHSACCYYFPAAATARNLSAFASSSSLRFSSSTAFCIICEYFICLCLTAS